MVESYRLSIVFSSSVKEVKAEAKRTCSSSCPSRSAGIAKAAVMHDQGLNKSFMVQEDGHLSNGEYYLMPIVFHLS